MSLSKNARRAYEIWSEMGWSTLRQKIFRRLANQGSWSGYTDEAMIYATWMDFSPRDVDASQQIQDAHPGDLDMRTLLWLLPEFQHPFYGGIYTLLRFADYLWREKGIQQHFAILGNTEASLMAARIAQGFPSLAVFPVQTFNLYEHIQHFGESDAAIATLWPTAYFLLRYQQTRRKFYFIQDYEPLFYPAGSVYAQVEATYRFGFYGIANTPSIRGIYTEQYGGQAACFEPCVDTDIFYPDPNGRQDSGPLKIFFYGRPGHPRNGFELGAQAMRLLKKRMGDRVHIVAAGDRWKPKDYGLEGVVENLGLLEYQQTAELYRSCAVGLVMMFTRHPSYLPFELMASGTLVVTNHNPATVWFLKDHQNCRLSRISATCLAETLEEALDNQDERQRITSSAVQLIRTSYSDWNRQIEQIYRYMCNPAAQAGPPG